MAEDLFWHVDHDPDPAQIELIAQGVIAHGRASAGLGEPRPLACFVFDGAALIAGAAGRIEVGRLFVQHLWVDEPRRGAGLGAAVLARIESTAREMGCRDALIETLLARVAQLYLRLGYRTIAQIPDYIPGSTKYVFLKTLTGVGIVSDVPNDPEPSASRRLP
jgi:GNAT superfamily N-acetyltransferase